MNQKDLAATQGISRFALLETLENNIQMAYRRGLDAARSMGADFAQIKEQELYKERGYATFNRYIDEHSELSRWTVEELITVSKTAQLLEDAGLRVPTSEAQMIELARLEPERQKFIWKLVMDSFPQEEITAKTVRIAVKQEENRQRRIESGEETKTPGRGVRTALDMDNGEQDKEQEEVSEQPSQPSQPAASKSAVAPGRITLTQEGEEALDRIRSLCGEQTAQGIERGYVSISERDLIKWADQSDTLVRNLEHYICDLRWSVRKALEREERIIDGESTLDQLIMLARARRGRAILEHQDYNEVYKIIIERIRIINEA